MEKFKNNYHGKPSKGEKLSKVHETIQGQAYKVKDLINKHLSGLDEKLYKPGYYDDNPDLDSDLLLPEMSDLTDIDAIKAEHKELTGRIDVAKAKRLKTLREKEQIEANKAMEAKIEAEVMKRLKNGDLKL